MWPNARISVMGAEQAAATLAQVPTPARPLQVDACHMRLE